MIHPLASYCCIILAGRGRGCRAGSKDERRKGADGRGREPGRGDHGGGDERRPLSSSPPSPTRNRYISIRREKTAGGGEETRVR